MSNATAWSLSRFPYGLVLRMSHAAAAVKHWDVPALVRKHVESAPALTPFTPDSVLESDTAQAYVHAVMADLYGESCSKMESSRGPCGNGDQPLAEHDRLAVVWRRFARLICSQGGPFNSSGMRAKSDEVAKLCHSLWPNGPPQHGDKWIIPARHIEDDFTMKRSFLVMPISN